MSINPPTHIPNDDRLDRYLDGLMNPTERADFEKQAATNPALLKEIATQATIDANLRALFNPSHTNSTTPIPTQVTPKPFFQKPILISAAAAALLLLASIFFLTRPNPLAATYLAQHASGFQPAIVCTTDDAFASWTGSVMGQSLVPVNLPASVQLLGWTRTNTFSSYTGLLLARVNNQEVLVVMDRTPAADSATLRSSNGLHFFKHQVAAVRLIEITPLDHPTIINTLQPRPTSPPPSPGAP